MMPLIGCGKVSGRTPIHLGCVYCIVDSLFWKRLIKSLFLLSLTSFYSGLKSIPARVLRFVCIALVIRKSRTVRWRKPTWNWNIGSGLESEDTWPAVISRRSRHHLLMRLTIFSFIAKISSLLYVQQRLEQVRYTAGTEYCFPTLRLVESRRWCSRGTT